MKKFILAVLSSIMCLSLFAQETTDVNRLIMYEKSGNFKGYILDKVDYIEFDKIDGEVAADVVVSEVSLDKVIVSVTRTLDCEAFKLSCFPSARIAMYGDDVLASLVDDDSEYIYDKDFEAAEMAGMEFEPSTDYTIVTVGIDAYGVLCDVRKVEFTTPSMPLVGDPQVEIIEVDVQQYQYTFTFKPNADVSKFSFVTGEKGQLQSQYEMFAPMFGFSNMGQMIEAWGISSTADTTYTWTNMSPGTEYEILVQAWDAAGTMAPYQTYALTTTTLGGDGVAEVEITLGDYVMADWGGEMLPSQFITYTPNDQSSAYRFSVYMAENYDVDADAIKAELCSEPPMPMTGWFFYDAITTDYQINPNTECVVIAAAKNAKGEWGPVNEVRFTTPAEAVADMSPSKNIAKRAIKVNKASQPGTIPAVPSQGKVMLMGK